MKRKSANALRKTIALIMVLMGSLVLQLSSTTGEELSPWEGQDMFPPMNKTDIVHEFTLVIRREQLEGHRKIQNTVNHTVPGPLISIPLGDTVSILVINEIPDDFTTLHWHGMTLSKEGFSDGVVGLTQCPIQNTSNMNTVRYRFTPQTSGTYWYHAHFHSQYPDGLYGALIVSSPWEEEAYSQATDGDSFVNNEDHVYLIADYFLDSVQNITKHYLEPGPVQLVGPDPIQDSFTVNNVFSDEDRARFDPRYEGLDQQDVPSNVLQIQAAKERMRFANTGAFGGYDISVDRAILEIIEMDGVMVNPVFVSHVMLHVAQRISFLLHFTESIAETDAVYLKVELDPTHYPQFDPSKENDNLFGHTSRLPVNYVWKARLVFEDFLPEVEDRASFQVIEPTDPNILEAKPVYNTFQSTQLSPPTHIILVETNFIYTGINEEGDFGYVRAYLNGETFPMLMTMGSQRSMDTTMTSDASNMTMENMPLLYQYIHNAPNLQLEGEISTSAVDALQTQYQLPYSSADNVIFIAGSGKEPFVLPHNAVVDIVIDGRCCGGHPFHLHGHHFYILDSSSNHAEPPPDTTYYYYYAPAEATSSPTHSPTDLPAIVNPTLRDIAVVPQGGWVRLRIFADNPGVWIFHCHVHWHMEMGLAATFIEAPRKIKSHYQSYPIPADQMALCMDGVDHSKVILESTLAPMPSPTSAPPTSKPTSWPTSWPSAVPISQPSATPTEHPTSSPTLGFDPDPTFSPTTNRVNSDMPTPTPTLSPTTAVDSDATHSNRPSLLPTLHISFFPTVYPTVHPTVHSTVHPTVHPTTLTPTATPSLQPTAIPTQDILLPVRIQFSFLNISTFLTVGGPQQLLLSKALTELIKLTTQQVLNQEIRLFVWVYAKVFNNMQVLVPVMTTSMQLRANGKLQTSNNMFTIFDGAVQMMPASSLLTSMTSPTSEQLVAILSDVFLSSVQSGEFLRLLQHQIYLYSQHSDSQISSTLLALVNALNIANASLALTNTAPSASPTLTPTRSAVTTSSFSLQHYFHSYLTYIIVIICVLACCLLSTVISCIGYRRIWPAKNNANLARSEPMTTGNPSIKSVSRKEKKNSRKKNKAMPGEVVEAVSSPANTMDDLQMEDLIHDAANDDLFLDKDIATAESKTSSSQYDTDTLQYLHTADVAQQANRQQVTGEKLTVIDPTHLPRQPKCRIEKKKTKNKLSPEHLSLPTLTDPNSIPTTSRR